MKPADLAYVLVVAYGARLLAMWIRTRALPELLLGMSLVVAGSGGAVLRWGIATTDPELLRIAVILVSAGPVFTLSFAYQVFRPGETWAKAWVAMLLTASAVGVWHQIEVVGLGTGTGFEGAPSAVLILARSVALGWCAFEAARYLRMYNKRLALGLADPVVANRFLLYAVWMGSMALLPLLLLVATLIDPTDESWRFVMDKPAALGAGTVFVCMVLIFTPPRAYVRFIEARHASDRAGLPP